MKDYMLLFGHLADTASGLRPGDRLKTGDVVGFVGDTGSPELVHLHLEARRVRSEVSLAKLVGSPNAGAALIANENSIVCDPRNVLPLRAGTPTQDSAAP